MRGRAVERAAATTRVAPMDLAEVKVQSANCLHLWRSVLRAALDDTLRLSGSKRCLSPGWWETDDCRIVCDLADIDHGSALRRVRVEVERQGAAIREREEKLRREGETYGRCVALALFREHARGRRGLG